MPATARDRVYHVLFEGGTPSRPSGDEHAVAHDARAWLPLLDALAALAREGRRKLVTLFVPPSALTRWADPRHPDRLARHVAALAPDAPSRAAHARVDGALLDVLRRLARAGVVEIGATALTGAFLPAMAPAPPALRLQIEGALSQTERRTGTRPRAFWLPGCGIDPEVEPALAAAGVEITVVPREALRGATLVRLPSGLRAVALARASLEPLAEPVLPDVVAHDVSLLGSSGLARLVAALWQSPGAHATAVADTLSALAAVEPRAPRRRPALASAAPSGAALEWIHPGTAALYRHLHHAARAVARAAAHGSAAAGTLGHRALCAAVRELAWLSTATCEGEHDEARERHSTITRLLAALEAGPEHVAAEAAFVALLERRDGALDDWSSSWVVA